MRHFSYIVQREDVVHSPKIINLEADEKTRVVLADRFGLQSVDRLQGEAEVSYLPDGLRVKGHLSANIRQACVVSFKPVSSTVEESFSIHYCIGPLTEEQEESVLDVNAEDIEELIDGEVDVAEVLAQTLALALDPFPRAPGVELPTGVDTEEEAQEAQQRSNPFAILKNLSDKA